jgi:hypothetical protein
MKLKFCFLALVSVVFTATAQTRRTLPALPPAPPPVPARTTPAASAEPIGKDARLVDLGTNDFDRVCLMDQGGRTLGLKEFKWHHAQTTHFVLHYENSIFAQKVARMAEFFYDYISDDMKVTKDLRGGRSHIFIFNSKKDWDLFQSKYSENPSKWVASWVKGTEMFLQQTGGGSDAADTLGHEMTHLIINRFFDGDPPLAINEGLAEWYGEFAYAAFKGVKKSKKQEFKRFDGAIPLPTLLAAQNYPDDEQMVRRFYLTAKYFVGFLMIERPQEKFAPFFADLTAGTPVQAALEKHYGLSSAAALEKEFTKFVK